ncbi:MAG: 6,7-dimethyl-8-ribityllumazine synthase [Candidatus Thermoplasmatota archaeon]
MEDEIKIGIVVSEFNYDITMMMLERAKEHANFLGAKVVKILKVPGVFEIPLAIKSIIDDVDGVVAIGTVIQGETKHDEVVMHNACRKIIDLSVEYTKPVGLAITGHGISRLQAEERIDRAKEAVEAVVKMCRLLKC